MNARRILVLASVALAAACGISAVGELVTGEGVGGRDSGEPVLPDGSTSDSSVNVDAGFDAQGKCLEVCEAGTCDAGTCEIDCAEAGACTTRVVCPPGVACGVTCGTNSCTQGVDCQQATACAIDCDAAGSCTTQGIACSGSACNVQCGASSCTQGIACDAGTCSLQCTGAGSCTTQAVQCQSSGACTIGCEGASSCAEGVSCDAGSCNIRCAGNSSCQKPVECNAVTDCVVQCGGNDGGPNGQSACSQAVSCTAGTLCGIACTADNTCKGQQVVARAANVNVSCLDNNACNQGPSVSGGDASVTCQHGGACGSKIFCDAGNCFAQCLKPDNLDVSLCCAAGVPSCAVDSSQCDRFKVGCP
jgi:hypothetical protein